MPFDATRVPNDAASIQTHLTDFAAGVTSVDKWEIVGEQERRGYVVIIKEFTA